MRRVLMLVAVWSIPHSLAAQDTKDTCRPMIDKAMAWLVKQQADDGHWPANNGFPTATTAYAGMALLADGNTLDHGKYRASLRNAMTWYLKQKPKEKRHLGVLGDLDDPANSGRYMPQHGVALSFLAKLYGEIENKKERDAVRDLLRDAVAFTVKSQSTSGGWFYTSTMEGHNASENVASMLQLQGLIDARDAGIAVPADTMKKARNLLRNSTTPQGGISYFGRDDGKPTTTSGGRPALNAMALAAVMARGEPLDELGKRWLGFLVQNPAFTPDNLKTNSDLVPAYYLTKVVYHLDERQWRAAFGDKAIPKHFVWRDYRGALFDRLQREQDKDGSWSSQGWGLGPVFNTSLALNILLYEDSLPPPISR
jgi:hypothetical protein